MIFNGILCLSLGTVMTVAPPDAFACKPALSMPRHITLSKENQARFQAYLRAREREKITQMVCSTGGKPEHAQSLVTAAREFEIDPVLLAAVTFVESGFRPRAASSKGARGMMQLRPVVLEVLGVTDPWDPHENIMAGAAYLKTCFERYAAHHNSTYLALAAYNIGPGPVEKLARSDAAERFVRKVLQAYNKWTSVPIPVNRECAGTR
ncbi:MAG TPA: lytic transglycosylase domain-containing protein [Desulfomonilaceae bacterium]|nr:lytic transglycosylase domain-containing protein [Desulfomonilaceae bacterium]